MPNTERLTLHPDQLPPPVVYPQLEIDPVFLDEHSQYEFTFNSELFTRLLKNCGISDEEISELKVVVSADDKNRFGGAVAGSYRPKTKTLFLFPNYFISTHEASMDLVSKQLEKQKPNLKEYELLGVLKGRKRFAAYVNNMAIEAGHKKEFVQGHILSSLNRRINAVIYHEIRHLVDFHRHESLMKWFTFMRLPLPLAGVFAPYILAYMSGFTDYSNLDTKFLAVQAAGFVGSYIGRYLSYKTNGGEKRANEFEHRMSAENTAHGHAWSIVSFKPRDNAAVSSSEE